MTPQPEIATWEEMIAWAADHGMHNAAPVRGMFMQINALRRENNQAPFRLAETPPRKRIAPRLVKADTRPSAAAPSASATPLPARPRTHAPDGDCCWPLNDGRPWLFCGEPRAAGKRYCQPHCNIGYVPNTIARGG